MMSFPPDFTPDGRVARLPVPLHIQPPDQLWRTEMQSDDPAKTAGAALALGRFAAASNRLDEAVVLLRQAAESEQRHVAPRALVQLVPVLESLDRRSEAEEALRDAQASSDPEHTPDVSVDVAAILTARSERDQAIRVLRSVIDAWPRPRKATAEDVGDMTRAIAALRLGDLLVKRGLHEDAVATWQLAMDTNYPAVTPVAALRLADAFVSDAATSRPPAEIEELYRVAIDFGHPSASPQAALRLAEYLSEEGQATQARDLLRQVTLVGGEFTRLAETRLDEMGPITQRDLKLLPSAKHWFVRQASKAMRVVERSPQRALIVGAGTGGRYLLRDLSRAKFIVVGWVDDRPSGPEVCGFPVLGRIDDMDDVLAKASPDVVLIAIPTMSGARRGTVVEACLRNQVPIKNLPTMFELLRSRNIALQMRDIRIEETLGDQPMEIDRGAGELVRGRNVMITGTGDSLGEELCRQVAHARARHLALVDLSATALQRMLDELRNERRFEQAFAVLGGCDRAKPMRRELGVHSPHVVFHVPSRTHASILESQPVEALRTNVLNTWEFARACGEKKVDKFVLVSSSDATSLRGVFDTSKALAEHALAAAQREFPETDFVVVRVGNLYRSAGSVVEIFERQIKVGAPITLTDARAKRSLMRVQLATQLLMRAAEIAEGGHVYSLNGGECIGIQDLAEQMIRLRGYEPGKDIPINVVGPRPWEKREGDPYGAHERAVSIALDGVLEIHRPAIPDENVTEALERVKTVVEEDDPTKVLQTLATDVRDLLEPKQEDAEPSVPLSRSG